MRLAILPLLALLLCAQTFPETNPLQGVREPNTTLIYNADGIQVGSDGKLQRFNALLFDSRTGRVKRVYRAGDRVPVQVGDALDVHGRTLLPGLIDAHGHVGNLGELLTQLDLVGTSSLQDMQDRLRTYAAAHPDRAWIVGRGWNQELWPDKRFPTAADLDSVVRDRPVALERVDGHAHVLNSAALRAAGISSATKDPAGGRIERDAAGNPTGLLVDTAEDLFLPKIPAPTAAERVRILSAAQDALLASGLTAVADMGTSAEEWSSFEEAGHAGRLKIRIMAYSDGLAPLELISGKGPSAWLHGDRLRLGGVKLYGDGALGSRGAWLKHPYSDSPETIGLAVTAPDELHRQAAEAAAKGFQVAIHAIGDRANAEAISIFEQLGKQHSGDRRWRIEHVQVVDPADIPRLAPAAIIASMQPVHQTSDRLMAEARLGPDRLAGAYAWQSILKSGARLAFGSDFPVESPNPFPGLSAAISRQDMDRQPPGGWIPSERLTFEQALHAFTRGAAYAGFAEDRIGSLEPGKWADFILIDRDPTKVDPQQLARTQVLETWIAGKRVWERAANAPAERGK